MSVVLGTQYAAIFAAFSICGMYICLTAAVARRDVFSQPV